jgi:short-subunit dehydrogenase
MKIFITGGTSGIGLQLAKDYLEEGHHVAICGRDFSKLNEDLRLKLKCYELDVREKEKLARALADFASSDVGNSRIDLVIANAGISMNNKTTLPDFERLRTVFDVNINGVLNTIEPALSIMLSQQADLQGWKGQIAVTGSVAGFNGLPKTSAYSASKAAVMKLCETFAIDLSPKQIAITTIAPGFIDTPLTKKNKHAMPFLMTVEKASFIIRKAIAKKKFLCIFPLPMRLLTAFMYYLPRSIYVKMMIRFSGFFYRKTE